MSKQERSMGEHGVQTEHHRIEGLHVTGGFLAGERFDFVDGLNCLIGGRGAGKTTAFEFLRYGLGMMPEAGIAPQRVRGIEALVKANLGSGRTSVEIRTKMGMLYTADRGAADAVQVRNEAGAPAAVSLDRNSFFGADVYSQNEVEEIASNAGAQLTLLDRFVQEEASGVERELAALRRQLEQTTVEMVRLDGEIEDVRAEASEVAIVAEKLRGFENVSGPDATMLNQAHAASALRQREVMALDELLRASDRAVCAWHDQR